MKSAANEEYKCFLPSESKESPIDEEGPGEPAEALLAPIFTAKNGKPQCSYRLEVSRKKSIKLKSNISVFSFIKFLI